jgi:hypothetical protein
MVDLVGRHLLNYEYIFRLFTMLKTSLLASVFFSLVFCPAGYSETRLNTVCRPTNVSQFQRVTQRAIHHSVPSCKAIPTQIVNLDARESLNNSLLLNVLTYKDSQGNYYKIETNGTVTVYKKERRTR